MQCHCFNEVNKDQTAVNRSHCTSVCGDFLCGSGGSVAVYRHYSPNPQPLGRQIVTKSF